MTDDGKSLELPDESARARRAYEMRLAGMPPHVIKEELRYNSIGDVSDSIRYQMGQDVRDITSAERGTILAMELARLDALQEGLWMSATLGDPKSVQLVINIIALRAKLMKLDQPDADTSQQTVLIMGNKEGEYIEGLKALTGD